MEFEEIYSKIFVYKNVFKDVKETLKVITNSEKNPENSALGGWHSWYTFGKETDMLDVSKCDTEQNKKEIDVWEEVIEVFYKTTDHYSKYFNVPIDREATVFDSKTNSDTELWRRMGPSICKYEPGGGIEESDLTMHYHTDYQKEREGMRGYKFAITCTMYLNDDYDGGGVDFFVDNKLFYYKPKAGDILVFPAGDPKYLSENNELYYHGVKKVTKSPKYFIRNHWTWFYDGDSDWKINEDLYGKEIWAEMENARIKEGIEKGEYTHVSEDQISLGERIR